MRENLLCCSDSLRCGLLVQSWPRRDFISTLVKRNILGHLDPLLLYLRFEFDAWRHSDPRRLHFSVNSTLFDASLPVWKDQSKMELVLADSTRATRLLVVSRRSTCDGAWNLLGQWNEQTRFGCSVTSNFLFLFIIVIGGARRSGWTQISRRVKPEELKQYFCAPIKLWILWCVDTVGVIVDRKMTEHSPKQYKKVRNNVSSHAPDKTLCILGVQEFGVFVMKMPGVS